MNKPVSIVIPAYNAAIFIGEAIESVLKQRYAPVECIVIDDGSTDETAGEVRKFGARVRYHYRENQGCSAAKNQGLNLAGGDFVAFLDADDLFEPNKIGEQVRWLNGHPDHGAVYAKVIYFEGEGVCYAPVWPTPSGEISARLLMGNFIASPTPLFRKTAVLQAGGYDINLTHSEDWDLYLRLAISGLKFGFIDQYLARYRVHATNTSRNRLAMAQAKMQVIEKVVREHREKIAGYGLNPEVVLAHHRADLGKFLCLDGQVAAGRKCLAEALREDIPQKHAYRMFSLATHFASAGVLAAVENATYRFRKTRTVHPQPS